MEPETNPLVQRRRKLEELKRLGHDPYPHKFDYSHTVTEIHGHFDAATAQELEQSKPRVRLCGRIMALRPHGKAGFFDLFDGERRLQAYVRRDRVGPELFSLYELFDLGDIVGVEGTLFRTRTNELTVLASSLTHLAKNLLPLPEKWHGLTDVEIRFRQRYVDLIVNHAVRETFVKRGKIIREIRNFLDERGYLEVETPVLQTLAGGALARPFKTHHNALDIELNLRIALELHLKRLIVGGIPRVYELSRIFRNEGISTQHNPEFTMLEFYEAYQDYHYLMDLTEELLRGLAQQVSGGTTLSYQGETIDLGKPFERLTMAEAVAKYNPRYSLPDLLRVETLRGALENFKVEVFPTDGLGLLQLKLFEQTTEDKLVQPTFIVAHPTDVSPLARSNDKNPAVTDRFELFITGRELANGFSELNDPEDQAARFRQQAQAKEAGDEEAMYYDADYVRALEYGLPPTAGEGIGIDRLVMLLTDSPSIRDVILFPQMRPE